MKLKINFLEQGQRKYKEYNSSSMLSPPALNAAILELLSAQGYTDR